MKHILNVVDNTIEGVKSFLDSLSVYDNDFNGENGPDYLWDYAEAEGYESNYDYAYAKALEKENFKDIIHEFIDIWMKYDSYYEDYDIEILEIGDKLAISFVYTEAV